MEYVIIIMISIIFLIALKFAWSIKIKDIKTLKEVGYDSSLNEITNKLPENQEICKAILKKLNNEQVTIKEEENNTASLYIAISNTIMIANIKNTFSRVQTIAHECLHSIQNRRTLLFNFFFSNIYFLYFFAICILRILKILKFSILHVFILTIFGFIYYTIRSYLEIDAMTKAEFLAKEYMEEEKRLSPEEIAIIAEKNKQVTEIGIKLTNYQLILNCFLKIVIFAIINIIF